MKILIIEDELPAAKRLIKMLFSIDTDISVLEVCKDIKTSVEWLKNNPPPQLILSDIELADGKSFEIFKHLHITSPVIFITAYDEFAIKAIKLNALDYLLKPVTKNELIEALEKARKLTINNSNHNVDFFELQKIILSISKGERPKKLAINTLESTTFIDMDNIVRLEGDSNYSHIFLCNGRKLTTSRTLKEYEDLLSGLGFFRAHKAHIINLLFVDKYVKGSGTLLMSDGTSIDVSRDKKAELIAALSIG